LSSAALVWSCCCLVICTLQDGWVQKRSEEFANQHQEMSSPCLVHIYWEDMYCRLCMCIVFETVNHSIRPRKCDLYWNNGVSVRPSVCYYMCNMNIVAACVCNTPEVQTVRIWVADPNCGLELPGQNCSLELFWCLNWDCADCWPGLWFVNTVNKLTGSGNWYLSDKVMALYKRLSVIGSLFKKY
jgi:hypothetical protein